MVEQNTQNPTQARPEPEPPSEKPQVKYRKTLGDKLFDLGVYGGVGYLVNGVMSVAVTRQAVHKTNTSLHRLSQKSEKFIGSMLKTVVKNPGRIAGYSKTVNEIAFLGSGGWLLLLPMKWLEDNKTAIIQRTDSLMGTAPKTPEALEAQRAYFEDGPKQNFTTLVAGRAVGYVLTIVFALPFVTRTTGMSDRLAMFLNKQVGPHLSEGLRKPLLMVDGKVTEMPILVDNVAKEIILAGTAAGIHYFSSQKMAELGHALSSHPSVNLAKAAQNSPNQPNSHIQQATREQTIHESPALAQQTRA